MEKGKELVSFYEEMLSRSEYLIPLVAACFQYPIHYYGMTSAALLEDLFVDASINFRNNYKRDVQISRPERASDGEEANAKGIKGWDYQFQGEHFSHKVGKGIGAVALLWDATVKLPENKLWTYENTMVYVLSHYKKLQATLTSPSNSKIQVSSIFAYRNKAVKEGQTVLIAERLSRVAWKIHEVIEMKSAKDMMSALPLDNIWGTMINYWNKSTANKFDIFITKSTGRHDSNLAGSQVEIDYDESMTFRDLYWMYRENTHKMLKSLVTKTLSGGEIVFVPQEKCASGSHKLRDTLPHISKLANGWDTTIRDARRQLDRNLTSAFYPPSTLSEI